MQYNDRGFEREIDESYCSYLPDRPELKEKDCNTHCALEWRVRDRTKCSSTCGPGNMNVSYACMRVLYNEPEMLLEDAYCEYDGPKPAGVVDCEGPCEGVKWRYGDWNACSKSCGGGLQIRTATCVDVTGKILADDKCLAISPVTQQECGVESCPRWMTGDWTAVRLGFYSVSVLQGLIYYFSFTV